MIIMEKRWGRDDGQNRNMRRKEHGSEQVCPWGDLSIFTCSFLLEHNVKTLFEEAFFFFFGE